MRAQILNHPIHPMLVPLPIGLWIFSFACDLVYRFVSDLVLWDTMALFTMAGGIAGALLAALPGFLDYLSLEDRATRRVATAHMLINLTTVGLYGVNLWLRTNTPPGATTPFALSIVGIILLSVAGWLGGELVFRHGVAVVERSPAPGSERL